MMHRDGRADGAQMRATNKQKARLMLEALLLVLLIAAVIVTGVRGTLCPPNSSYEILTSAVTPPKDGPLLTVTLLDVGQGDAILLQSPNGRTMLIDAGPEDAFDAIRAALRVYEIKQLDAVVATHPHADHIGSMADVLKRYPVGAFFTTDVPETTIVYEQMLRALQRNGCPVYNTASGMEIVWDDAVSVKVLNPIAGEPAEDANNASIVLRVCYGSTRFLLAADLESAGERRLLDTYGNDRLRADVLKVGHHGSDTSSCKAFLDAVHPSCAIISDGRNNAYGHPHPDVLNRLQAIGASVYRTDTDGVITLFSDGDTITIVP